MNPRNPRGSVVVEEKGGKWRIRLPRTVCGGKQLYISTSLEATPANLKKCQAIAWQIEEDIKTGQLDPTLKRYKSPFETKVTVARVVYCDLLLLWDKYCEFKKPQLSATTYAKDYRKYRNHILSLPDRDISNAVQIRDYLLANLSPDAVKRTLTYISACCGWATKSGLITGDPFSGMSAGIRKPKGEASIDPFTSQERDEIIKAFYEHPNHRHYAPFVKFLFLTGCRTGEAIALQWQHINQDCSQITFSDSYDSALGIRKTTKTGISRRFPCNATLRDLLLSIKPTDAEPDTLIFKSPTGLYINNSKFTNQVWKGCKSGSKVYKGIVTQLAKEGRIDRYRCLYNTRHTFITMALDAGISVQQVAKWVGNSPKVIYDHYAGCIAGAEVPIM